SQDTKLLRLVVHRRIHVPRISNEASSDHPVRRGKRLSRNPGNAHPRCACTKRVDRRVAASLFVCCLKERLNPRPTPLTRLLGLCDRNSQLIALLDERLQNCLVNNEVPLRSPLIQLHATSLEAFGHLLCAVDVLYAVVRCDLLVMLLILKELESETLGVVTVEQEAETLHVRANLRNLVLERHQRTRIRRNLRRSEERRVGKECRSRKT